MKKVLIPFIFIILFLGIFVKTNASVVLNGDIISLIQNGLTRITEKFYQVEEKNFEEIEEGHDISGFIDQKNAELEQNLTQYKNEKLESTTQELNAYIDEVKSNIDALYDEKEQAAKDNISKQIDQQAEELRKKILDELNKKFNK